MAAPAQQPITRDDLTFMRDLLSRRLKDIEEQIPDLDRAIARLDELIDVEDEREDQQARIRVLSEQRRAVS